MILAKCLLFKLLKVSNDILKDSNKCVCDAVCNPTFDAVCNAACAAACDAVCDPTFDAVCKAVCDAVCAAACASVWNIE